MVLVWVGGQWVMVSGCFGVWDHVQVLPTGGSCHHPPPGQACGCQVLRDVVGSGCAVCGQPTFVVGLLCFGWGYPAVYPCRLVVVGF